MLFQCKALGVTEVKEDTGLRSREGRRMRLRARVGARVRVRARVRKTNI